MSQGGMNLIIVPCFHGHNDHDEDGEIEVFRKGGLGKF